MGRIYRLLFSAFILIFSLTYSNTVYSASDAETYFVITAYYSPLPGQSSYLNGNYSAEIRMNGKGTNGASGKEVFEGMLAAPRNYPFGTKIYFEGYGIGEVQDRGGAIVPAGQRGHAYDRIDIWMGYGDEGLARAKTWGQRTIKGKIVIPSSERSLKFGESKLGNIGNLKVSPESPLKEVQRLQDVFTKADLYNGKIDGKYSSIESELIDFQIKQGIVKNKEDWGAGYFGNKTIAALRKKYGMSTPLVEESISNFEKFNHVSQSKTFKIILDYGDLEIGPESKPDDIRRFQELLTKLGEYSGKIDGEYEEVGHNLINLQKKIGLISNRDDWGAGYFGSKTKTALWEYYGRQEGQTQSIEQEVFGLSSSQVQKLDTVIQKLRKELIKRAKKKGVSSNTKIQKLKNQIQRALPKIKKESVKNKLRYIAKEL